MRVAFVSRYPPVHCGVAEYTRLLAHALLSVEPRLEVYVLSTREAGGEPYREQPGVRVVPSYERFDASYSGLLDALAEIGGVDVLHLQHEYGIYGDTPRVVEAMLEARGEGLARSVVATLHTVYHPYGAAEKPERLELYRVLQDADAVVAHSYLQEFELYSQGLSPRLVNRIPHGTLVNPYLDVDRPRLARGLGVDPASLQGVVLAIPGFLRPDKGLDTLLEAARSLARRGVEFTLVVAGEPQGARGGEVLEQLREARETTEWLLHIDRYLSGDELLKLTALADALVLPYRDPPGKYAVSGILHMSMGSMKPIVGTRVPRLVELYQYAPRLAAPPGDPAGLAQLLEWLIRNYDYTVAYMSGLYSYAVRTQWIRMARRHLQLYRRLAAATAA